MPVPHRIRRCAAAAAALLIAGCANSAPPRPDELWIRGARVVDPRSGGSDRAVDVVVHAGRIVAVEDAERQPPTAGARVVEAGGLWLAPGPFDAHVHVSSLAPGLAADDPETRRLAEVYREQVGRSYLLHGFTQVVDLTRRDAESIAWFGDGGPAPDLFHADAGLTMAGGYPLNFYPEAARWEYSNFLLDPEAEPAEPPMGVDPAEHTPEAAVGRVDSAGGIAVKVFWETGFGGFSGLPTPPREILDRIAAAAHERGLPVVVHANSFAAWDFVTRSPVDALVHGMWNWNQHERAEGLPSEIAEVVDRTIGSGIAAMPSTRVIGGLRDLYDPAFLEDPRLAAVYPPGYLERLGSGAWTASREELFGGDFVGLDDEQVQAIFERVRDQGDRVLRAFVEGGGRLVFGSDTPSSPVPTNPPGLNGRLELEHFEAIGLDPIAVARSLTVAPAELFGLEDDYGEVAVGRKANLLLLRSDPLASIAAWGEIDRVVLGGTVLDPRELRADR